MSELQSQLETISELLRVTSLSDSDQEKNIVSKACLKLLTDLEESHVIDSELLFLQGFAWYISPSSDDRDANVLAFLSAALELDFEHLMAKVYLCHYLFDIGDHGEFLKHYQQLNVSQFKNWRHLKFLEMNLIAKMFTSSISDAELEHFIQKYENAQDTDRPKIRDLFDFSFSNESKLSDSLKSFIFKWANYWGLSHADKD